MVWCLNKGVGLFMDNEETKEERTTTTVTGPTTLQVKLWSKLVPSPKWVKSKNIPLN